MKYEKSEFIKEDTKKHCHEEAIIESAPHAIQRIRNEILEAKKNVERARKGEEE